MIGVRTIAVFACAVGAALAAYLVMMDGHWSLAILLAAMAVGDLGLFTARCLLAVWPRD